MSMLQQFGIALALLLVVEGIMPFLSPSRVRQIMAMIAQMSDSQLRFAGITSMLLGVLLLYILR